MSALSFFGEILMRDPVFESVGSEDGMYCEFWKESLRLVGKDTHWSE
jgi:hypothetical protein